MTEVQKKRLILLLAALVIVVLLFLYLRNNRKAEQRQAQQVAAKRKGPPTPTPTVNPNLLEHTAETFVLFYPTGYEQREDPNAVVTFINPEPNKLGGTNWISVTATDLNVFKRDLLSSEDECREIAYVGVPTDLQPKLKETRFINKPGEKGCLNIYSTVHKLEYVDYHVYKIPAKAPLKTFRLVAGYPAGEAKSDEAKQILGALYQFTIK